MTKVDHTCWTLIRSAAQGEDAARNRFANLYQPIVQSFLRTRWRKSPLVNLVEDATQEVFLECLKDGGILEKADPEREGGFRAFLYGVVRRVALRFETKRSDEALNPSGIQSLDTPLPHAFDRAWARSLLRQALDHQSTLAEEKGEDATKRVELLRLRFQENLPIREIASRWNEKAERLHHEFARARDEYRGALKDVVGFHFPGLPGDIDRQCRELIDLLRK